MTVTEFIPRRGKRLPLGVRMKAFVAVTCARWIIRRSPQAVEKYLTRIRTKAGHCSLSFAQYARESIEASSMACRGPEACLLRSVSVTLFCRLSGVWPTWCVGARTAPPFAAHAWVEVDDIPVGECGGKSYYTRLFTVPPVDK